MPSELVHVTAVTCTVVLSAALSHLSKQLPKPWPRKERWLPCIWGFPAEPGTCLPQPGARRLGQSQGSVSAPRGDLAMPPCCSFLVEETAEWILCLV